MTYAIVAAPRGIIFDFGNTLLREGPVNVEAGALAVLRHARDSTRCSAADLTHALTDVMQDLEARRQAALIEVPPATVWRLVYEPLGLEFGASPEDLEWIYWEAATTWELEPGINGALKALDEAQIPWGVLSNTMFRGQTIERQCARSGLRASHRFVMGSADYILRKPHPRVFKLAATRLTRPPAAVWFVGDSHEHDVCGAAAAGLVPIWYCPRGVPTTIAPAAHAIGSWADFLDLLSSVLGHSTTETGDTR